MTESSRSGVPKIDRTGLGNEVRRVHDGLSPIRHERLLALLRVVLAQRVADEAFVEQDRPQVEVAAEADAVHVVALAFHEGRRAVERAERVDDRLVGRRRAS
jgi:hypothetical protein